MREAALDALSKKPPIGGFLSFLHVCPVTQTLTHFKDSVIQSRYTISTGKNGLGEQAGSEQTPQGWHIIRAKIGQNAPLQSVFVGRRLTGEIYSPALAAEYPGRDWILTRIMWLSGIEPGVNRLGNCDTMRRYIYIHGSPDTNAFGTPGSHGCIQMKSQDIVTLFDTIDVYTPVFIGKLE